MEIGKSKENSEISINFENHDDNEDDYNLVLMMIRDDY